MGTSTSLLKPPPLSAYVHLPWCVRKCPYCDFNSHRAPRELPVEDYLTALLRDLDLEASEPETRPLESVFFGGGTPSLFPPEAFAQVLARLGERWDLAPDAEITLEANPGTVEHAPFDEYVAAGINRVSLGVQSFDDEALKRIGRIHGGREASRAAQRVLEAGFDAVNLDLMYALPGQDERAAIADVRQAIELGPVHLSHYHLTIEPNTLFAARPPTLPEEDRCWAIQQACQDLLAESGYEQYEVSAYATPGGRCRHNLNYWRFGDYLGIGAGAHGKMTRHGEVRRRMKQRHPVAFMQSAGRRESVLSDATVSPDQRIFEFTMNAFRLREGFLTDEFRATTGIELSITEPPWATAIAAGLVEVSGDRLRASPQGWDFLNELLQVFLPDSDYTS